MNERQQKTLALVPKFSASISIVFSSLVIYSILRKKKNTAGGAASVRKNVYNHLLLGVSVADLVGSFWYALSTRPIPKSSNVWGASGNQTSCDMQGFFIQGGLITSILYMGSITTYFLLMIRLQWKQSQFKQYEWCFHFFPIAWGVSTAIATIPLKISNNANLWCYIAPSDDPGRGHNADFYRMLFFYCPLYLTFVVVTVNVVTIVSYVRRVTAKAELVSHQKRPDDHRSGDLAFEDYDANEEDSYEEDFMDRDARPETPVVKPEDSATDIERQPTAAVSLSSSFTLSLSSQQTAMAKNRYAHWRRKASRQSFGFALAFYCTWIPISLGEHAVPFWLLVISAITTPLQGMPVLLVHYYPKYIKFVKMRKITSKGTFLRWIRAGMATSAAQGNVEEEQHQPEEERARIRRAQITDKSNEKYAGILAERESHVRDLSLSSILSEPVYGLQPIQENESTSDEESVRNDPTSSNLQAIPLAQSTNPISESKEFDDEDYGITFDSHDIENRLSCLSESEVSVDTFMADHKNGSRNEWLSDAEFKEITPERGDVSRWKSKMITSKKDSAPCLPRALPSENSDVAPPKVDSSPKIPRRLASDI